LVQNGGGVGQGVQHFLSAAPDPSAPTRTLFWWFILRALFEAAVGQAYALNWSSVLKKPVVINERNDHTPMYRHPRTTT
jgi:hypothetical protein